MMSGKSDNITKDQHGDLSDLSTFDLSSPLYNSGLYQNDADEISPIGRSLVKNPQWVGTDTKHLKKYKSNHADKHTNKHTRSLSQGSNSSRPYTPRSFMTTVMPPRTKRRDEWGEKFNAVTDLLTKTIDKLDNLTAELGDIKGCICRIDTQLGEIHDKLDSQSKQEKQGKQNAHTHRK